MERRTTDNINNIHIYEKSQLNSLVWGSLTLAQSNDKKAPGPPTLLVQNLSSKQIVTTDNIQPNIDDNYIATMATTM